MTLLRMNEMGELDRVTKPEDRVIKEYLSVLSTTRQLFEHFQDQNVNQPNQEYPPQSST